jgi:hypothetical protein
MKLNEALEKMTEFNFTVSTTINISNQGNIPEDKRVVIRQDPQAGQEIAVDTSITLYYGTEKDYEQFLNPTPVPTTTTTPTTTKPPTTTTTKPPTTTTEEETRMMVEHPEHHG